MVLCVGAGARHGPLGYVKCFALLPHQTDPTANLPIFFCIRRNGFRCSICVRGSSAGGAGRERLNPSRPSLKGQDWSPHVVHSPLVTHIHSIANVSLLHQPNQSQRTPHGANTVSANKQCARPPKARTVLRVCVCVCRKLKRKHNRFVRSGQKGNPGPGPKRPPMLGGEYVNHVKYARSHSALDRVLPSASPICRREVALVGFAI